ncbi:unnamed protein product [Schistocephalus solidus]|uniref:Uncharacterized protein n=1 Tax=Schistocephalus solidus TaxID=70667 RepID=A0A183SL34_SCHSO|nr:unnamed protein product [Schistocephalus solidus]
MGHTFNFDAAEIVGRGADHTRQIKEAWMSTDCSDSRNFYLPASYLVLRTFLSEDRHGMEQPGPPTSSAANEDGGRTPHSETPADVAPGVTAAGVNKAEVGHGSRGGRTDYRRWGTQRTASQTDSSVSEDA